MHKPCLIGAKVRCQNPALKLLEFLFGDWQTTGSHPAMPGQAPTGRTSFAWYEDCAFLIMRLEVHALEFPDGIAMFSSDDVPGEFVMTYFD